MKKILTVCSLVALCACSQNWDVEGVANKKASGTSFDKSLKNEYVELAIIERSHGDWDEVDRLLTKAISAAEGATVELTAADDGSVSSQEGMKMLETSRQQLLAEFKKGARDKKPEAAARAQIGYDCMVNAWKWEIKEDVASCKAYFDNAMAEVTGKPVKTAKTEVSTPAVTATAAAAAAAPEKTKTAAAANKPAIPESLRRAYMENGKSHMFKGGQYMIYYAFGSAEPAQNIDDLLKSVVTEYRIAEPAKVEVSGYTDTAGSVRINEALSLRRAKTVANALVKSGIEESKIEAKGFGETVLAVPTADNVAEPRNRRTVIEFK